MRTTLFILWALAVAGCMPKNNRLQGVENGPADYREPWRPQFHFSPASGWMNDPNGMVFYDGEYHLFYQHYPDSTVWGPMHWGHAISTDLVHWKQMPVAIYPDTLGWIFSGSAVLDAENSSGLGTTEQPALVAIYTYHNDLLGRSGQNPQSQGIAYSTDKGRTWTKYPGNPVLKSPGINDFRDPKVFRHEPTNQWIMALAVQDRIHFYSSPDLLSWSFESEFGRDLGNHGGVWECPDLFPLEVEGSDLTKWVLLVNINPGGPNGGSANQYFVGDFDGHTFSPDPEFLDAMGMTHGMEVRKGSENPGNPPQQGEPSASGNASSNIDRLTNWVDWGRDNYAGVTWSNVPATDGRRLLIGWMSNWQYANVVPTSTWRSANTTVRELKLISENESFLLLSLPVRELQTLRDTLNSENLKPVTFSGESMVETGDVNLSQCEIMLQFDAVETLPDTLEIILENELNEKYIFGYASKKGVLYSDRTHAGNSGFSDQFAGSATAPFRSGKSLQLHLFVDAASAEIFVDGGKRVMTEILFPTSGFKILKVNAKGGEVTLSRTELYSLQRIW
jgi:fructan beta-fructosidase